MNEQRGITIYFMDGTHMKLDFPTQPISESARWMRLKEILAARQLLTEVDGALMVFPFENVKYIVAHPAPPQLPEQTIKAAAIASAS